MSGEQLAEHAGLGVATVWRFEGGEQVRSSSIDAMRTALESAGVTFIASNGEGPGVRLSAPDKS